MGYSFNMQGIGVIFGEGAGELALQKCRLIALQFRQNFKPRVDFVHYTPSQRSFYAFISPSILYHNGHSTPSQRTIIVNYTPSQRTIIVHYPPSLPYIYANPSQSNRSFRHTYSSISIATLSSIIRISNAISTDNTP